MYRVLYYSKPRKPFLIKLIKRGFSCTPAELFQELQTACGPGAKLQRWESYSSLEAARTVLEHCKPEWKEESLP